jgi:hypothetical protein
MQLDNETIQKAVVAEVADRVFDEENWTRLVTENVEKRISKLFDERFTAIATAKIDALVHDGFSRTYQPVSGFGQPNGPETTIGRKLEGLISNFWTQKVNSEGAPSDGYNSKPRAEWMLTRIVAADLSESVKQQAANVAGPLKDMLRKEMHGVVNKMLGEVFHVRSADDQKPPALSKVEGA